MPLRANDPASIACSLAGANRRQARATVQVAALRATRSRAQLAGEVLRAEDAHAMAQQHGEVPAIVGHDDLRPGAAGDLGDVRVIDASADHLVAHGVPEEGAPSSLG